MKASRILLLKEIYEYELKNNTPLSIPLRSDGTVIENYQELIADIRFLKNNGYIIEPLTSCGAYHLSLTEKGESFLDNGCTDTPATSQPVFNFSGANISNSVVGTGISGNEMAFSYNSSLSELKELISTKDNIDQEQLQDLLSALQSIEQSDEPVSKCFLARFSDLLKKHTDLIVPLGTALVRTFMGSSQ